MGLCAALAAFRCRTHRVALDSIKAWAKCDYLLTFELHVPLIGGQLQSTLDWVLSQGHGVGSWYIGGDVPRQYYDEDTDGGLL